MATCAQTGAIQSVVITAPSDVFAFRRSRLKPLVGTQASRASVPGLHKCDG